MEEWQKAMILQAERQDVTNKYLMKINGTLAKLATKEEVEEALSEAVEAATGIKDKLLWVYSIAIISIAGATAALKIAAQI